MKNFLLLLLGAFLVPSIANSQSKFWVEMDGIYWQKYGLEGTGGTNYLFRGTVRPWLGMNIGNSWDFGIMADHTSYRLQEPDITYNDPIFYPNPTNENQVDLIGYQKITYKVARKNEFNSFGFFLRKSANLGERMSLDFSLLGLFGSGEEGEFEIYYVPIPCPNCLQISSPIPISIKETSQKVGIDLGWQYRLSPKLSMGVRTNVLQFTKTSIEGNLNDSGDNAWIPFTYNLPFGDRKEFGSGITREGVRILVQYRPF